MAVLTETEKSISERVIYCFELLGYNKLKAGKTEFAQVLGVNNANLSKYFSLDRPFPIDSIVNLANKHKELSPDWLFFGSEPVKRGSVLVPYLDWRDFNDYISNLNKGDSNEPKLLINFPFNIHYWDESHYREDYINESGLPQKKYIEKQFRAFYNPTNNITGITAGSTVLCFSAKIDCGDLIKGKPYFVFTTTETTLARFLELKEGKVYFETDLTGVDAFSISIEIILEIWLVVSAIVKEFPKATIYPSKHLAYKLMDLSNQLNEIRTEWDKLSGFR